MSKKTKKKQKRPQRKFPWLIVALGAVLVTAAFLFLRPGEDYSGGTPAISVDQQNIDMGYIKLGEYRTIKIKVTNTGDGVLRFKEQPYLEVVEGCCPPNLSVGSMVLNPGQSTYVETPEFMMHAGMDGKHDFAIHLETNDPKTPELLVHVLSDWGP
jgi:HYDIN/CFA65/VesB family protein